MDRRQFDMLARQLGSRRSAVGGLLAGLLLPLEVIARGKQSKRRQKHRKRNGKDLKRAVAQDEPCWRAGACIPRKGANVSRCDLAGYTAPPDLNCTGCNVSRANLSGADFRGANFTKANLSGACLVDADFTNATFANNTNLANATFCRTTMPNGLPNDSGCSLGTPCCPTCTSDTQCPANQRCVDGACRACDVCASGCAHASVQAAIAAASAGATIVICPGTYATSATIDKNLTLLGSGMGTDPGANSILDGGQLNRVLFVNGGVTATLRALTVARGKSTIAGGGLWNSGDLTLDRVLVSSSEARDGGGGITNVGNLTLIDSAVRLNTAGSGGPGGGIYNSFSNSTTTLVRSVVEYNTALLAGGIQNFQGTVNLTNNSHVRNNSATAFPGGGVNVDGGTLTVTGGSTITANTPQNCTVENGGTGCPA